MATFSQAINSLGNELNSEFNGLVDLMADIADGDIGNGGSGIPTTHNIGGQTIAGNSGSTTEATEPGTMLRISTATSTQAVYTGQLTDAGMKASQLQKQTAQKIS